MPWRAKTKRGVREGADLTRTHLRVVHAAHGLGGCLRVTEGDKAKASRLGAVPVQNHVGLKRSQWG